MNLKEFLSALRNEKPIRWMGYGFEAFPKVKVPLCHGSHFHMGHPPVHGEAAIDNWGGTLRFPARRPRLDPDRQRREQGHQGHHEMARLRQVPVIPTWTGVTPRRRSKRSTGKTTLIMVPSFRGLFEARTA